MQTFYMILAHKGGRKQSVWRKTSFHLWLPLCWKTGMLAEHWNDIQSPPPPIPPLLTRRRDPSPRTALVLGKEILLGHEVWGLPRSIFLWKKEEPLITKHIYPIKIGWVTRQESPPSTKGSQLGSWLARKILAGEWEKLTGGLSGNKNVGHVSDESLQMSREAGLVLGRAVAMVAPGAWDVRGKVLGLSKRQPRPSRLEPPWGWWGVIRKGTWLLVKIITLSSYFSRWGMPPNFQAKLSRETFSAWR